MTFKKTAWVLSLALLGASAVQAQTCKTEYDPLLKRYNTRCDDGTRSKTEYDSLLKRYDTTIQSPYGGTQRCTQHYDNLMRQWITKCH